MKGIKNQHTTLFKCVQTNSKATSFGRVLCIMTIANIPKYGSCACGLQSFTAKFYNHLFMLIESLAFKFHLVKVKYFLILNHVLVRHHLSCF